MTRYENTFPLLMLLSARLLSAYCFLSCFESFVDCDFSLKNISKGILSILLGNMRARVKSNDKTFLMNLFESDVAIDLFNCMQKMVIEALLLSWL
jgi:hypothetical protein